MKCRISFVALLSVLSLSSAVTVDYYPHEPHAHHPAHVNYIEPAHVKPVKYFQPAPVAPVYKPIAVTAAPIKYIQHEPHHVKYVHQEPHHVKYVQPEPHHVKYVQPEPHHVKYVQNPHYSKHVDYDEPAQYEFGYEVHDPHTGDVKSHSEKRSGDTVHGSYTVLDPDGFKRIVEYTADEHNGFNAVVRREPVDGKIIKKVYEPELVKHVAPVKYFTPQSEAIVANPSKYVTPVHQKIVAPIAVKQFTSSQYPVPQYYAPPEHPKFFKPVEKFNKFVKPAYEYEPHHTAVKYVTPAPHYNHY